MDGSLNQIKGRFKEAEGRFIGDDSRRREEKPDRGVRRAKEKAERAAETMKDALTGNSSAIRLPGYRRSLQSVPAGSVLLVSADWPSWDKQTPDAVLLPEQFFSPLTSFTFMRPEAALMRAVLEDALACFQKQFEAGGRHVQRLAREAEKWLLNDDFHWPFSFVSICAVLGLEPTAIRRELKRWSHSHSTMPQRKRRRVRGGRQLPTLVA